VKVTLVGGAGGARRIHEWDLTSAQHAALRVAAAVVRAAAGSIGDVTWAR
jgi:hypothetical protein